MAKSWGRATLAFLASVVLASASRPPAASRQHRFALAADFHQHLLSPAAAAALRKADGLELEHPLKLPPEVQELLRRRSAAWNDPRALEALYSQDAIVTESAPITGRKAVSDFVGTRFDEPYEIRPLAFAGDSRSARVAAMYTHGNGATPQNVGLALITLEAADAGQWHITGEAMKLPGPDLRALDSDQLVKLLDAANIRKAVVLSVAYFFESPLLPGVKDGAAKLRAENDWTASQVSKHASRLVGFCSVNPLTQTALREIERCARVLHLQGLKLHFGNSAVNVEDPAHLRQVQSVFAAADRLHLPIVVHLWTGASYGRLEAETFLTKILPHAPHVPVQIAHMAGGGPGWTDEALQVFVQAVQRRDATMKNVYFDVATVADLQTPAQLTLLARRIRQIGLAHILYGSDAAFGEGRTPLEEWRTFTLTVPLTSAEFKQIAGNMPDYMK